MKALYDRVITEYGHVMQSLQGPEVVFESNARRKPEKTQVLRVGHREHVVLSIPENVGLETSGGRALVVLVLVGYAYVVQTGRLPVYHVMHSVYDPSPGTIVAVHARVAAGFSGEMSYEQIFHEVKGCCYEETRTRE